MSIRDDHYRNMCDYPPHYDKVIDLIKRENKHCAAMAEKEREEFACQVLHSCISGVLFGTCGDWSATGGAIAIRVSGRSDLPGYRKVIVAFHPCGN